MSVGLSLVHSYIRSKYLPNMCSFCYKIFCIIDLWLEDQELFVTDMGSVLSKPLDKKDTINKDENLPAFVALDFTETYNKPIELSPSYANILNSETNIMATSVNNSSTLMGDNKFCKTTSNKRSVETTESGSYSVPSIGSSAARSPYRNDFEDLTPHPSPLHDAYQARPYLPLSPGGSGGTTCDSFESDSGPNRSVLVNENTSKNNNKKDKKKTLLL